MTLVLDLPDDLERRLAAKASARGESMQDYVLRLVVDNEPDDLAASEPAHVRLARKFWESVPDAELHAIPTDLSARVDDYLYGDGGATE